MELPNPSYDADRRLAEFYDLTETGREDVELIRRLLGVRAALRIFEPFCGTGRILIPLAQDGHRLTGMDVSQIMLDRAVAKLEMLSPRVRHHVQLIRGDCTSGDWPGDFDAVLLAGNCLYELETPEEQRACVHLAAAALRTGGHLLLDNDHMEGDLAQAWCQLGVHARHPNGTCPDGTQLQGTAEVIWYDRAKRLCRWKRRVTIVSPDGGRSTREWMQQKHPPSIGEVRDWLLGEGFEIETSFGDHRDAALRESSPRAIFWARKR
jgi:SAM-dependent methyltransferase